MNFPYHCPPNIEEMAEEYHFGRLTEEAVTFFEIHTFSCPDCAEAAERAIAFIYACKAILKEPSVVPQAFSAV